MKEMKKQNKQKIVTSYSIQPPQIINKRGINGVDSTQRCQKTWQVVQPVIIPSSSRFRNRTRDSNSPAEEPPHNFLLWSRPKQSGIQIRSSLF